MKTTLGKLLGIAIEIELRLELGTILRKVLGAVLCIAVGYDVGRLLGRHAIGQDFRILDQVQNLLFLGRFRNSHVKKPTFLLMGISLF